MIQRIDGLAHNVAGFRASGTVTKHDYDEVVFPVVKEIAHKYPHLNFLMVMDTSMKNFTIGALLDDALLGFEHLTKWHRIAFVSDEEITRKSATLMNKVAPGEYRTFPKNREADAIYWVSSGVKEVG